MIVVELIRPLGLIGSPVHLWVTNENTNRELGPVWVSARPNGEVRMTTVDNVLRHLERDGEIGG